MLSPAWYRTGAATRFWSVTQNCDHPDVTEWPQLVKGKHEAYQVVPQELFYYNVYFKVFNLYCLKLVFLIILLHCLFKISQLEKLTYTLANIVFKAHLVCPCLLFKVQALWCSMISLLRTILWLESL